MILFPNAKINIGLYITGKRADGYHNLETVFYPVNICDALEILPADRLYFSSSGLDVPGNPDDNLCVRAFRLLEEDFSLTPVHIHLHKNIPMGAGLGGGSADAAFLIKMLNEQFGLGMSSDAMERYAVRLGADCPFFIRNTPVFADERGDRFKEVSLDLSAYSIAVVMPDVHVSTRDAFTNIAVGKPQLSLPEAIHRPMSEWKDIIGNDFEKNIFRIHPVIAEIKEAIYHAGAIYAAMSGSGAAVYGIFSKRVELTELEKRFRVFYA